MSLPRVALLTNILAPYRVPVYQRLAERFRLLVLLSGDESNRAHWRKATGMLPGVGIKQSWGFTFTSAARDQAGVVDTSFLHVNPGLILDLMRFKPEAVVSDEMGFRTLVALLYGKLFGRPVWGWWGGTLHTERGIGRARRLLRGFLAKKVDHWFTYGHTSTKYLVTLGVRSDRIVELQNCVPETQYRRKSAPSLRLMPKPVLLCVGQFIRRKGIDLLIQSAARLQTRGLEFSLLLVGDGPERPAIEGLVQQLRLQNVTFCGAQAPECMPSLYQSSDVLIFPTLEDVWGLVVNEALWAGLPALVSVYAGCAVDLVPLESIFDPLDPGDFDRKLEQAVAGQLPRPDPSRLRRVDEVSATMASSLAASIRARGQ